jgi:hypothetical protein
MPRIFISYRRADSEVITNLIYERLAQHFGGENIFIDREDIEAGTDFLEKIFEEIAHCDVMLVIIGTVWATLARENGDIRLFEDGDVVRAEVEQGLRLARIGVTVIPVTVSGAFMPHESALPKSIRKIAALNAPSVRNEPDFGADIQKLIQKIEKVNIVNPPTVTPITPPKTQVQPENGCYTEVSTRFGRLSVAGKFVASTFGVLVTLLGLFFAALPILPESQINALRLQLGLITPVPTDSAPILQVDERSDLIVQNALRVSLQDVSSNPRDLVIAPSPQGLALWGYSGAGGDLFALDIASGTPLTLAGENRRFQVSAFDNALTSALYYDDVWLWVGDSRNHRLLAFDPLTLELMLEIPFGANGQPVAVTGTGTVLWAVLQDTGELAAIQVNHEARTFEAYCFSDRLDIGDNPFALVPQGTASLWVAYGRGSESAVRQISVQNCTVADEIPFENPVQAITVFNDGLWGVADDTLWHLNNGAVEDVAIPSITGIKTVTASEDKLWLTTNQQQVVSYTPAQSEATIVLPLGAEAAHLAVFGVQLWVLTTDNTALQFAIPHVIYPNLVALAWQDGKLWAIDAAAQVCAIVDEMTCFQLELGSTPLVMTAANADGLLWLSAVDGSIWQVNLSTQTAEKRFNLAQPAYHLVDQAGQYLWATDTTSMLLVIDLNTGADSNILSGNFNIMPPIAMAFNESALWFAYDFPARLVNVTYDGTTLRQIPLVIPNLPSVGAIAADSSQLYASEPGRLFIIDPQQVQISGQLGLDRNPSGLVIGNNILWSYNNLTGFIFRHEIP